MPLVQASFLLLQVKEKASIREEHRKLIVSMDLRSLPITWPRATIGRSSALRNLYKQIVSPRWSLKDSGRTLTE